MTNRDELHRAIEKLNEEQLGRVMSVVEEILEADPWERWRGVPGVRVPDHWPPRFRKVERMKVEGEPVSEQLIRERR